MADSTRDKARKARTSSKMALRDAYVTADRNAKAAGVSLRPSEKDAAVKTMYPRMAAERGRTERRANFIEKREAKKSEAARVAAATGNTPNPKKAPKPKATAKATPKATAKPKPKATKKPITASEKAFLAGQKKKAKITKKTGTYPNTAN